MTRRDVAAAWSAFWFDEVDARPFALVRIGVALAGLQLWAGTLPLVHHFYSDAGELPIAVSRVWSSEYAARFLMPDALGAYPVAVALFGLWGLALLALLVGWRTRLAAWAAWLLTVWFFYRNATFTNGGDELIRVTTLYLALGHTVLSSESRGWSLDRRATGATGVAKMPAWPVRFVQIQLSLVYVVSGFWKLVGASWWDGSALQYALGNDAFSRFGAPAWAWAHPMFAAATIGMAWWELLFPVLATARRTRVPALGFGVVLHLWILTFMNIGVFPFIVLGCYPAFLRGDEAERLVAAVVRALPRGWRPAQPSADRSARSAEGASA